MKKLVVGYTTGVYDMLHVDHLNLLRRAKEQCDYLIVGVSTDELVEQEKKKKPIIPFVERAEIVSAIKYVNQVVPQCDNNKYAAWETLRFNKIFVGDDWKGSKEWEAFERQVSPLGVEIIYLPSTKGI